MKFNKWTLGLMAVGAVGYASAAHADEQMIQMSQVQTALSNTTISGYVDTAATWRPGTDQGPGGTYIPYYSFAKNDGFSLNAVDLTIDHPMDESPWAAGYHVELMAGSDAVPANNNLIGGAFSSGGFTSIRQAYIALRTPVGASGIDWKIGVFDGIIGYESSSAPFDPNYTRSYGYTIEPTTHTGILGTYKVNDLISVSAGIANTWNDNVTPGLSGNNATATYESQKTYMGAIALTAPDSAGWLKGSTLNAGVVHSVDSANNNGTVTSWYAGATIPTPINALKAGASFDYVGSDDGLGEAWVAGLYGSFQINDKASFNLRGEYLQDDSGLLYGNYSFNGQRNAAEEVTATLQYNLWANVISRVEFRWDHVEHGQPFGYNTARANDFLLALNLIYQF